MEPIESTIVFHLNNEEHQVKASEVSPKTSLNSYLRNTLSLKGTKGMCYEGGCGACIVVVERPDPTSDKTIIEAVNSCLIPVLSCKNWKIMTIEGIGDPINGYHVVQEVLAKFNGTQCGFCSSGMVMNMYALYQNKQLTMEAVENSFGGNICRCTGYRPILSAFKSLCTDADPKLLGTVDIEEIKSCQRKCIKPCEPCKLNSEPKKITSHIFEDSLWIQVFTLKDLQTTLKQYEDKKYMLICGNTAKGVFPDTFNQSQDVYINVIQVKELQINEIQNDKLVLGGNTSLTKAMNTFNLISQQNPNFSYLKTLAEHIDLIANVPVRNTGSLAGNLMIKYNHNEFQSDIFLILETVGALITIVDTNNETTTVSPQDFLNVSMKGKIIQNISLPSLPTTSKVITYKIMGRAQNTHAIVNAGFCFNFSDPETIKSATIVYGNITPKFIHATQTEQQLIGKKIFDNGDLIVAYTSLDQEINPETNNPDPSPEFRKQLAISLFYKAVLSIAPENILSETHKSGGAKLQRPVSSGAQDYQSNESLYPLTEPIPKMEALAQTSGQAEYIEDIPSLPNQLYAAFVLAKAPPGSTIESIDPSPALNLPNIVAFYSKDDVPGENNFMPSKLGFTEVEEIFCSKTVLFYHQPIGLIVGDNNGAVMQAADAVKVTYTPPKESPLLSAREILKAGRTDRIKELQTISPKSKGNDVKHVVKGNFDIYHQYHFHMETQCCCVVPTEDGLDVYPSSQWMDLIQMAISNVIKLPNNRINVNVRRCGGAFGAKITRNTLIACATALAAWKLRRPVKLTLPLTTNMEIIGKRWPLANDYEIGLNEKGIIQYLNSTMYTDLGRVSNETGIGDVIALFMANYGSDTFSIKAYGALTDTHANTWARAPGTTEGLCAIEAIMEHIAYEIGMDPLELRLANISSEIDLIKYIKDIKEWAEIDKRKAEIATFNKENRWKKKGIAVVPMAYRFNPAGPYTAMISIYHGDGTVAISHGGIEVGQGINTKAAQVCAYKFGIPLENVTVIPSKNFISPNSITTGGSVTSEAICYCITKACDELLARLEPIKKQMKKDATWEEIIEKAYQQAVTLSAIGMYSDSFNDVSKYTIYGICATEVLVDILTGQHLITRVDLIEDVGISLSPVIDIGQVEGAFVMGMGYYTTEKIVYDADGKILTNRTWNYTPPGAKDIPIDFRIKFPKDNPNPVGVLNSKAMAEPPLCLTVVVPLAIRNAVASARTDANKNNSKWYPFDGATTVENTFMNSSNDYQQYTL